MLLLQELQSQTLQDGLQIYGVCEVFLSVFASFGLVEAEPFGCSRAFAHVRACCTVRISSSLLCGKAGELVAIHVLSIVWQQGATAVPICQEPAGVFERPPH